MRKRTPNALMILLTAFVLQSAVRIEVLNLKAGNYLPRTDRDADGTLADGKWRISGDNTPRDHLRGLVQTYGLMQYLLAPLLLIISVLVLFNSRRSWMKIAATMTLIVAVVAIHLTFYRGYYSSLGL